MKTQDTLKQTVKEEEGSQLINYTIGSDATPICIGLEVYVLKQGIKSGCQLSKNQMRIRMPNFCQVPLLFLKKRKLPA